MIYLGLPKKSVYQERVSDQMGKGLGMANGVHRLKPEVPVRQGTHAQEPTGSPTPQGGANP